MKITLLNSENIWIWIDQPNAHQKWMNIFVLKAKKGLELFNSYVIGVNNSVDVLVEVLASTQKEYFFHKNHDIEDINDVLRILYENTDAELPEVHNSIELRDSNHLNLVLDKQENISIIIQNDIRQIDIKRNSNNIKIKYYEDGHIGGITDN